MLALDAGEGTPFPNGSRQAFDSKVEVVTREERLKSTFFELSSCAFTLRDLPWHCENGARRDFRQEPHIQLLPVVAGEPVNWRSRPFSGGQFHGSQRRG